MKKILIASVLVLMSACNGKTSTNSSEQKDAADLPNEVTLSTDATPTSK